MSGLFIVPSARLIPAELQGDFGQIPSCMIPFGGAPALKRILEGVPGSGLRAVVACHEHSERIEAFLANLPEVSAQTVEVGVTYSLGETLHKALLSEGPIEGRLVVNFGDTIIPGDCPAGDQYFYAISEELYRWTAFTRDSNGFLGEVIDKGVEKGEMFERKVFVGVFSFSDAQRFAQHLAEALATPSQDLDPFYTALRAYYNELATPPVGTEVGLWIDLGHLDTYYASRRLHAMGQRAFNAVSVDALRGILTKKSRNEGKFAEEIQWYTRIPAELNYLAPRVFRHSLEPGSMFIDLEYYGYPPLSDIFLFSNLDVAEWQAIFNRLAMVLEDMGRYRTDPTEAHRLGRSLRAMYLEKTMERLLKMLDGELAPQFLDGPLSVNGRPCIPLRPLLRALPDLLETEGLLERQHFSVIHGDFCLSNILFDRRSRTIRLVDPRGQFGEFGVYGDPRYDLAKLSHCFNGKYDFLVHGLFSLEETQPGAYSLVEHLSEHHRVLKDVFNRYFLPEPVLFRQVRIIESLLFLSMVPLHADRPRSQKALLLRGLETASALFL